MNYYQILGIIPPVSMAELKVAYRKAAALHHPDRGGNHEAMIAVNDAYEQVKWEVELADTRANIRARIDARPRANTGANTDTRARADTRNSQKSKAKTKRKPKQPRSNIPLSVWYLNIDELINLQQQKGYKKGWLTYRLMDSKIKPPLEAWDYLAQRLDYLPQWSKYKYEEWKPVGERETAV